MYTGHGNGFLGPKFRVYSLFQNQNHSERHLRIPQNLRGCFTLSLLYGSVGLSTSTSTDTNTIFDSDSDIPLEAYYLGHKPHTCNLDLAS